MTGPPLGSLPSRTVYPTFEKTYTYDARNRKSTGFAFSFFTRRGYDPLISMEKHEPITICTFSSVDTLMGEYNRRHTDMTVKVPGGEIKLTRRYYEHDWHLGLFDMLLTDPDRPPLSFTQTNDAIESIEIGGQAYDAVRPGLWVFNNQLSILRTETGYRWENKFGGWRESGSRGLSPAPSPLRTVLDSFPSYGSSIH